MRMLDACGFCPEKLIYKMQVDSLKVYVSTGLEDRKGSKGNTVREWPHLLCRAPPAPPPLPLSQRPHLFASCPRCPSHTHYDRKYFNSPLCNWDGKWVIPNEATILPSRVDVSEYILFWFSAIFWNFPKTTGGVNSILNTKSIEITHAYVNYKKL